MSYGELTLPPVRTNVNRRNGRFLKGHTPHNKGKKWGEWLNKRAQRRAAKGWKNLDTYRPKKHPETAGRCRKSVIAVLDDGHWLYFPYATPAAEWIGGCRENVGRCCRLNLSRKECKHSWRPGQSKGSNLVNTDHRYKGVRFYFEGDSAWTTKISRQ